MAKIQLVVVLQLFSVLGFGLGRWPSIAGPNHRHAFPPIHVMSIGCQNLTTRHARHARHTRHDTYHDTEKGSAEIKIIHVKTLELCAGLKSLILQVCKHQQRKNVLSKDDVDRLKYLYETVHLINFYVSSQSQENRKFRCASILSLPPSFSFFSSFSHSLSFF
jgi:hypothetical protein